MKLDELIEKNDEIERLQKEMQEIKQNAIIEIGKLKEIGIEIGKLQEVELKKLKSKCMSEAEEFFRSGKFELECTEKRIKAKREGIIIDFKDDSVDEMLVFPIEIQPLKVYNAIEVRPCMEDTDMFYQKNNLKIEDLHLDFNNYADLINKCNDKGSLLKLIEKTRENIQHYQNTVKKFESIKYIYSLYQRDIECDTFKEVFEKHVN